MKFIKKFEGFIKEEAEVLEPKTYKETSGKKPQLPMATAEDVAYRFIELIEQSGDDIKKYVEIE